jgi:hypothetical protein
MFHSPVVCTKEVVQNYRLLSKGTAASVFGKRCCLVGYSGQESWADILFIARLFEGCKVDYTNSYML